jgi:hypothetical protein
MKRFLRKTNKITRSAERYFRKMMREVQKLNNSLDVQIACLKNI